MTLCLNRRQALAISLAASLCPSSAWAGVRELNWKDLLPKNARGAPQPGVVSHSALPSRKFTDPRHFAIVPELDGEHVRLPGFLLPLEFDGTGGTEFLLVPFVGACIHVPPPPPNQMVHAISEKPYEMEHLFEPVYAIGEIKTIFAETDLAQASYQLNVGEFQEVTL